MLSDGKVVVFFYRFVAIIGQKYGSFSIKVFGEIVIGQNPFSAKKPKTKKTRKKVPMATKLEGVGEGVG